MKINQTNIHATKITLHDNKLTGGNYKLNPKYYKDITKLNDNSYKLQLSIEILNSKENPFPLDITVEFETTFSFENIEPNDDIDTFLNVGAIQMVFPFMRSALNNIVTSALLPPLVLPLIDVRQFEFKTK